jgi:LDH2 family malate/lactate/ureidoglycolate dehydrogenase
MWLLWAIVAASGAGLPAVAWWLTRRVAAAKPRSLALPDGCLRDSDGRPAPHESAAELLAGRVTSDIGGWPGYALAAAGASEVICALTTSLVSGHVVPWLVSPGTMPWR